MYGKTITHWILYFLIGDGVIGDEKAGAGSDLQTLSLLLLNH